MITHPITIAPVPTDSPAAMPVPLACRRPELLGVVGLCKRYADRVVLDELSFDVARGEIFGLLGPNGSGKSTALSILTGLESSDAGMVRFGGTCRPPGDRGMRSRLGVVFQSPSLDDRLTARENLSLNAALFGVPRRSRAQRVNELLAFAELESRADEPVRRLSGGMRRRLELSRALVPEPDLLLMDEPTTGLDEAAYQRTWRKLRELRADRGLTVLLTTHRADEAEGCDRLAVLDAGRLVVCETPAELRSRVEGDVVTIDADDPDEVARRLRTELGLPAKLVATGSAAASVLIEVPRGHEIIPRVAVAFEPGRLRSIALRRPSLGDAFLKLTGRALYTPPRCDA